MMDPSKHLRPDELDLWLEEKLSQDRTSHIETCDSCRLATEELREIVTQLRLLPSHHPSVSFANRVMASVTVAPAYGAHLTADDIDAWLSGTLAGEPRAHLLACPDCRRLADAERVLVRRLEQLPLFTPREQFTDLVMAQVAIPLHGWRARVWGTGRSRTVAAGIAALIFGSMGGSVAWSLTHQDTLAALGTWATTAATQLSLSLLQGIGARVLSQPWVLDLRSAATPGKVAALAVVGSLLYAGGLVALRRLLALPQPPVARAAS